MPTKSIAGSPTAAQSIDQPRRPSCLRIDQDVFRTRIAVDETGREIERIGKKPLVVLGYRSSQLRIELRQQRLFHQVSKLRVAGPPRLGSGFAAKQLGGALPGSCGARAPLPLSADIGRSR